MSVSRLIRSTYLLYFSQPAADRALFKAIKRQPVRSIVELGIGFTGRTQRLLEVAAWPTDPRPLRYTGIDLFEARPADQTGMSLKEAFAAFRTPDTKVQLVPGDPHGALRRVANSLTGTDLLLIAANQDRQSLADAWTWVPRMLSATSLIFAEEPAAKPGTSVWRRIELDEVQKLASAAGRALRRAA